MRFQRVRVLLGSVVASWVMAGVAVAQGQDYEYFDWPMGREDESGAIAMGHDVDVQQDYASITHPTHGPRPHAGLDLQWAPRGRESSGSNTAGAPVYAAADGEVICERTSGYPGRVVVIEHVFPHGRTIYSMYGHMEPVESDAEAIDVGARVSRGQQIGRVWNWGSNSHLHFEIRRFAFHESGSCAGPGYAVKSTPEHRNGKKLSVTERDRIARAILRKERWTDPVAFYYRHRPPYPRLIVLWSREHRNVRSQPSTDARVLGQLPPSSRLPAYGVRAGTNPLDWWYRIRFGGGWAWVNGFLDGNVDLGRNEDSQLAVGEYTSAAGPRRARQSLIHYRFDEPALFARGMVYNWQRRGRSLNGIVHGSAELVSGPPITGRRRNLAIELDGHTAFVEVQHSEAVDFENGVGVRAMVRRDANRDEDAILSKWYGNDQWLLTMYPDGNGRLIFTVRLSNGAYVNTEYMPHDDGYLGNWVEVEARYDIVDEGGDERYGLARLYWGGAVVATRRVETAPFDLWPSESPIHVGDANNPWSRFDGAIDEVRIWQPRPRK